VTLSAAIDDTRYNTPSEPTQTVAAAELYIDAHRGTAAWLSP